MHLGVDLRCKSRPECEQVITQLLIKSSLPFCCRKRPSGQAAAAQRPQPGAAASDRLSDADSDSDCDDLDSADMDVGEEDDCADDDDECGDYNMTGTYNYHYTQSMEVRGWHLEQTRVARDLCTCTHANQVYNSMPAQLLACFVAWVDKCVSNETMPASLRALTQDSGLIAVCTQMHIVS